VLVRGHKSRDDPVIRPVGTSGRSTLKPTMPGTGIDETEDQPSDASHGAQHDEAEEHAGHTDWKVT
jgi:hypothetical protein